MKADPVIGGRIIEIAQREFPTAELNTALWLLRECADDDHRLGALIEADGDLTTLVLAVEDRADRTDAAGVQS